MDKLISYASNFEDVMLWRALKSVTPGFYVDIGAHHPVADSVTKAFYERGWRGINVEPTEYLHALLVQDRPRDINIRAAIATGNDEAAFYEVVGTGLSTTNPEVAQRHRQEGYEVRTYQVPAMTLAHIYKAHHVLEAHFLKIDVEGAESDVLRGAAFNIVRPWIIVIEATEPNTQIPTHMRWEQYLIEAEFQLAYFDGVNRYYVSKDHAELVKHFQIPPNVFDNFIQYPCWRAQQDLIASWRQLHALEEQIRRLLSTWSWRLTKPFRAPFILLRQVAVRRKRK